MTRITQLGQMALPVLIGCAIGTAVRVTIAPPLRYRSAEYSVRILARARATTSPPTYTPSYAGPPDPGTTARWRERAGVGRADCAGQSRIAHCQGSIHYNPRRLLRRCRGHLHFHGYETVLNALERSPSMLTPLTGS
ncbi:hypothetical protein ACFPN0_26865 [Kitasatospora cinereorecta]